MKKLGILAGVLCTIALVDCLYAGLITKPYTFINGGTADATQVNSDFDTLYTLVNGNINTSNLAGSANIPLSQLDSTTVAGVSASQTLTNKTLTTPIISTPNLNNTLIRNTPMMISKTIILPAFVQSEIANIPLFPVVSTFTNGITIDICGIKLDSKTAYSVDFQIWSDPLTYNSDVGTVSTSASQSQNDTGAITVPINSGSILFANLPSTTGVNFLNLWCVYEVN